MSDEETGSTAGAGGHTGAGASSPAAAGAPRRRGPSDLPFRYADLALADALADARREPDWLRADRREAAQALQDLPTESNQLYTTYVDLRSADLMDAVPYVQTASASTRAGGVAAPIPDGASGLVSLAGDGIRALELDPEVAARGVVLETFGAALERDPQGLRADLEGGRSLPASDRLAQLARGFWAQGIRIIVPDGVQVDRPIVVRWEAGSPGRALVTRSIVRIGAGAGLSLVEELGTETGQAGAIADSAGGASGQALFAGTSEVELGRGATLAMASLQDFDEREVVFLHRHARIGPGADLRWALAQLGGRLVRSRVDNLLVGDGSSVEQVEIVFGSSEQFFDLTSYTRHIGRDTTGNLLSKGALQDASRAYFKGLITIDRTAVGTDSFLGEYGMLLSRRARSVAIPSLEIDQPDCRRAAHSSSVGPIDPNQLFYLESRGLEAVEARKFIVLGFLEPVVARVPLEAEQDRLRDLLDRKWEAAAGQVTAA